MNTQDIVVQKVHFLPKVEENTDQLKDSNSKICKIDFEMNLIDGL